MQSFKVGAPDAEFLEKEYAPVLSAQDIIGVANYKSYMKLNIDNTTSRVFSINAIFTEDYKNDKVAEILKQYCAKKYGRKKEFVDAEIAARLGMLNDEPIPQVEQPVPAEQPLPGTPSPEQPLPAQPAPPESAPVATVLPTETTIQSPATSSAESTTPTQV